MVSKATFIYFAFLALAMVSLSWAWSAFGRFLGERSIWNFFEAIVAPAVVALCAFVLFLFRYAYEKAKGRVRNEVVLFERLLKWFGSGHGSNGAQHG